MDKILSAVASVLAYVAWSKAGSAILLLAAAVTTMVVYEQRSAILDRLAGKSNFAPPGITKVSADSISDIERFMRKNKSVMVLTVVALNMLKNERHPIHRSFNSDRAKKIIEGYTAAGHDGTMAMFTRGNEMLNEQMIAIINGDFSCNDTPTGGVASNLPPLKGILVTSCRSPVPPLWSLGARGYLVAHFDRRLSVAETDQLRLELQKLSMSIYHRDVVGESIRSTGQ